MVVQSIISVATPCPRMRRSLRRDELEQSLLEGLAESVLRIEVIDYAVAQMEEAQTEPRKAQCRARTHAPAEATTGGQTCTPCECNCRGTTGAELHDGNRRTRKGTAGDYEQLLVPGPGSLSAMLDELRTFAVSRLTEICELISDPESVGLARAVLAEHFGTFTLEPTIKGGEPVYLAHGKVDFFGEEARARTGGAGETELDRTLAGQVRMAWWVRPKEWPQRCVPGPTLPVTANVNQDLVAICLS